MIYLLVNAKQCGRARGELASFNDPLLTEIVRALTPVSEGGEAVPIQPGTQTDLIEELRAENERLRRALLSPEEPMLGRISHELTRLRGLRFHADTIRLVLESLARALGLEE